MTKTSRIAIVLALGACGGKAGSGEPLEAAREQQPHAAPKHGSGEAGEGHGALAAPVEKFHDTLAPRWHAAKGPARMADTCGALATFHADAAAIVAAPAPDGVAAEAWKAGGSELAAAVDRLDAGCQAKDAAAFEPAFEQVHTSFHHLVEAGNAQP